MPSPFPGMDPYLESPDIWPDFHDAIAAQIRSELNRTLPAPYYARLEMRPEVGIEVRDSRRAHVLVTLIEIVSPANKQAGVDRETYQHNQQKALGSDASLVEIDLLRTGRRVAGGLHVIEAFPYPGDYLVSVSRACRRRASRKCELFRRTVRDTLPCIPIPLREGEAEVRLDLQYILNLCYDSGPYRRGAVDYSVDATPSLKPDDRTWATHLLREAGLRP